jgi:hypothetical protein
LFIPGLGFGQESAPRIAVAGGLLGHTEGFPELPSSQVDFPIPHASPVPRRLYGGLEGLRRWLENSSEKATPVDLLLLGGDNLPITIGRQTAEALAFMSRIDAMTARQATVAALSTDDIVRFLRGASIPRVEQQPPAQRLEQWLRNSKTPLLASNVVIKIGRDNLNVTEVGDISLEIDPDTSIGWEKELRFSHPCGQAPTFALSTGDQAVNVSLQTKKGESCHTVMVLDDSARLQPSREYVVVVTSDPPPQRQFRFSTDRPLTPVYSPATSGFPVSAPLKRELPWVIALVDPDSAKYTGRSSLKWRCAAATHNSSEIECQLSFLPAVETVRALLDHVKSQQSDGPPFVALLSSMPDAATSEVMAEFAALRIVVLPADSGLLGRAVDEGTRRVELDGQPAFDQPVITELRSAGLLDGRDPSASALLIRPEWLAETVVTLQVRQATSKHSRSFVGTSFGTQTVPGAALCWSPAPNGHIAYSLDSPNSPPFETYRPYPSGAATAAFMPRVPQRHLWTDQAGIVAAALDVMRANAHAELALTSETIVDEDVIGWLRHVRDELQQPLNWLSRLTLERALYRADAYVRVVVPGKELVSTLNKILEADPEDRFCAAGIGHTACGLSKIDDKHLLVNGRHIDEMHFYSVAMFRSVADRHALHYDADDARDIVEDLDERFRRGTPAQPSRGCVSDWLEMPDVQAAPSGTIDSSPTLGMDLEALRDGPQHYLRLEPMGIAFAITNSTLPDGANAALFSQAIEGASPKDAQRWHINTAGDLGLFDTPNWTFLRGVGSIEYQQEEVSDVVSIDKDEFVLGMRADRKIRLGDATLRLFGGVFSEGGLKRRLEKVSTARILERVTDPSDASRVIQETFFNGPELSYETRPRRFIYGGFGAELAGWSLSGWWKITQFSIRGDLGESKNELSAVLVSGRELSIPAFLRNGATATIRNFFTEVQRNPTVDDSVALAYGELEQRRLQLTFNTEHALGTLANKDVKLTNEFRYRRYEQTPGPVDYSLRWSVRDTIALTLPVWSRLSAVLKGEAELVEIAAIAQAFEVFRVTAGLEVPLFGKHAGGGWYFR